MSKAAFAPALTVQLHFSHSPRSSELQNQSNILSTHTIGNATLNHTSAPLLGWDKHPSTPHGINVYNSHLTGVPTVSLIQHTPSRDASLTTAVRIPGYKTSSTVCYKLAQCSYLSLLEDFAIHLSLPQNSKTFTRVSHLSRKFWYLRRSWCSHFA